MPEDTLCRLVTWKRSPDEIVYTGITDVFGDGRINVPKIHKTIRQPALGASLANDQRKSKQDDWPYWPANPRLTLHLRN